MGVNDLNRGTVYWLTGLSGAGKTTIGKLLYGFLHKNNNAIILWDGDTVRDTFKEPYDLKYDYLSRKMGAFRDARTIKMISDQGIDVVICTIALIHEVQQWNRKNIANYREIYIECPMSVLETRDQKHLYSRAKAGMVKDVVGVDIVPEFPISPDLHIVNDGSKSPEDIFLDLIHMLGLTNT